MSNRATSNSENNGMSASPAPVASDNREMVKPLKVLMIEHSLPLWSNEGWDRTTGGFIERLDIQGRADRKGPRRVRVQARQIYCFAKAAQMGWYPRGQE